MASGNGENLPQNIQELAAFYHLIPLPEQNPMAFCVAETQFSLALQDELRQLIGAEFLLKPIPDEAFYALKFPGEKIPNPPAEKMIEETPKSEMNAPESAPIALLDELLNHGIASQAADIHFESLNDGMEVRMRIDGDLRQIRRLPQDIAMAIQSRLKLLAKLNASERFRPQDGRFRHFIADRSVDFRISVVPTKSGESIVLRLLDKQRLFPRLSDLKLPAEIYHSLLTLTGAHHGLFLVTGPTGSGKTTTLYGLLHEVNSPQNKILTIEDPVEYESDGLIQVPVDLAIGRTFSRMLRSFLRHDPDKILLGEIRDGETATIAIQGALTGHMVFSTLHTASPTKALLRLLDMGIDAILLSSCLRGILNQRLIRLNCDHCRRPVDRTMIPEALRASLIDAVVQKGVGCEFCHGSGFRGRQAIFEYLAFENPQRQWLMENRFDAFQSRPSLAAEGIKLMRSGMLSPDEFQAQIPWHR